MRYTIRRIDLTSVMRFGCALGWLVALLPALICASLTVVILQRVYQSLQQIEPLTITILGQTVARIDWLEVLRLRPIEQGLGSWTATPIVTVLLLTLTLGLLGSLLFLITALLVSWAYNRLAAAGLGLRLELRAEDEPLTPTE